MPKLKPQAEPIEGAEYIKDLARLELKPGDVLVVRTVARVRPEFAVYLEKQIRSLFPGVKALIVDGEIDLFVLRPAEGEEAGAGPDSGS